MTPEHETFSIERTYAAPPARVFAAWSDPATKSQWFGGPPERWRETERSLDFRVGGVEVLEGEMKDLGRTRYVARFHRIDEDALLVYAYDMFHGATLLSVSLGTVVFEATKSGGTKMTYTEQGAFFDDGAASRKRGTEELFDRLGRVLG
jgi:uncharacterized protein YndB with AHSA1/START domain